MPSFGNPMHKEATMATPLNTPQPPRAPRTPAAKRRLRLDLAYALAMIVGMVARELWDSLATTGAIAIHLPRLIGVLIWAPIVYVAIFARLRRREPSVLGFALAFQLGFFWTSILDVASGGDTQYMQPDRR
jgi:hypothetical protein